jgi:outer membrane receptor for ferrienterochelin and colicins
MNRWLPIVVFFALLTTGVGAQQACYPVSGRIVSGNQPVPFATVVIVNTSYTAITDTAGRFSLCVPAGKYKLRTSIIGYVDKVIPLNHTQAGTTVQDLVLEETNSALNEVVVSGTMKEMSRMDSPVPVEVYSARFFKANPTPSVFESLQNVNGVRPQLNCNVCNTGDIHINGLEGPYTMVLIDGMPIVSGLSTVYGLTGIPQALIERVEVVKGPASTLYGSEAVGGLINVITKTPEKAPVLAADVFSSSWGEVNSDVGLRMKAGKSHLLTGLNHFWYGNPIDNNGDGFTDVTLQHRISAFSKYSLQRKDSKPFVIAGRYVYEDRWGGQMNWSAAFRGGDSVYGESIYTNRWETFGTIGLPGKENLTFQFSANGHGQNSVYGNTAYVASQYVGFGQLYWEKELTNRLQLVAGAVYRYTWYDDNTFATAEFDTINAPVNMPASTHLPGSFVQAEIKVSETGKLLAGVRFDYNSLHGPIFSPRLNYQWKSRDNLNTLRLSVGNGYRVANVFTEDHAALTGARVVEFVGALKPETSWNGNVNFVKKILKIRKGVLGIDATGWYTYFFNRILPDYTTDPNKIIYRNLNGHSVSTGASLNLDLMFTNGFKLLAGVTAMDVSITENGIRSRQLLTEQVTGTWSVGYTHPVWKLTIDYTGNLYGPMLLPLLGPLDDRPGSSPWFSIQNIQITKAIKNSWEIYGGVKNLLNFTPPANSIARPFDPFDKGVVFDASGNVVATAANPKALTFDPSYVFAPNQGIRAFLGIRYTLQP